MNAAEKKAPCDMTCPVATLCKLEKLQHSYQLSQLFDGNERAQALIDHIGRAKQIINNPDMTAGYRALFGNRLTKARTELGAMAANASLSLVHQPTYNLSQVRTGCTGIGIEIREGGEEFRLCGSPGISESERQETAMTISNQDDWGY